jgi:peptide-methionine (R)-S-oxide reductase
MKSIVHAGVCLVGIALLAACSPSRTLRSAPSESAAASSATTEALAAQAASGGATQEAVVKSEEEWKKTLTPEQFAVLRKKGTERPFTGKYWNQTADGTYVCAGCGAELFTAADKFDAGCGWPSYSRAIADGRIVEHVDTSHGMTRTEVVCARCGGHLGHVFDDGPAPTGKRYCINSESLDFKKKP